MQLSHWMMLSLRRDLVEDLRPEPDVAHGAEAVARLRHRQPAPALRHALEQRQHLGTDQRRGPGAFLAHVLQVVGNGPAFVVESLSFPGDLGLFRCSAACAVFSSTARPSASSMRSSIRSSNR